VLASFDRPAAAAVYATNCASCHQAEGQGIQGAFPPLAGHAAEIQNAEGGRELLIDTVLFGLIGEIQVDGVTYNGLMPAWPQLDDGQIAGVVNHISTAWGNEALLTPSFTPVTAEEVAGQRGRNLSSGDVHEMRSELDLGAAAVEAPAETEPEAAAAAEETPAAPAAAAATAPAATAATADFDRESGAAVFASSCASCHQAEGQGITGVFPPLADHVPELYNAEGGREYLIHAVLFGLQGPISVLGTDYNGSMPAWPQLTDQRIADVVDHIATAWGNEAQLENFVPVTAEEVAAERSKQLSPADVHEEREALGSTAAESAETAAGEPAAETAEAEAVTAVAPSVDFNRENGERVYATNCAACHQAQGQGVPGAFPPLAGHAASIYNAEGGREVLIHTVLFGLQGQITADGMTYNGMMPAWPQLGDEDIANVVDHIVTAWGNEELLESFTPVTGDEIAAARGLPLSPAQVQEERAALTLQ
jgi:mono/diheme cytochrome c family protein